MMNAEPGDVPLSGGEALRTIYGERIKYLAECQKLYYAVLFIFGSGLTAGPAILLSAGLTSVAHAWLALVAPLVIAAWGGCFLFSYWDHHTMRSYVNCLEELIAPVEYRGKAVPRYQADFLASFNEANVVGVKAVWLLFASIGALPVALYVGAAVYGLNAKVLPGLISEIAYTMVVLIIIPAIFFGSHLWCAVRERHFLKVVVNKVRALAPIEINQTVPTENA